MTEIIGILEKPFLKYWYGKLGTEECEKIKRESAEYGTRLHELISNSLKGLADGYDDKLVSVFIAKYAELGSKPVEVEPEAPYVSKKFGYQGTFDWVERDVEGHLVMADLKITSAMHKEYPLQLSAYANLWNEKHEEKIEHGRIYRLDKKTGKLQVKEYPELHKYFKIFKLLIPIAKWVKEGIEE